ncbi:hypothetical protein J2W24_004710 [Variovorax boronicumulans]|uniref:hypothetical protein n=1 Tax=Variovorax boronicumulans TaxID=436515 RepID=UPI00277E0F61|nr:hypothetical protein [Variovorax boronicumulans]MDP9919041.1 hypothetical protein [Variovorax boronicumulans]
MTTTFVTVVHHKGRPAPTLRAARQGYSVRVLKRPPQAVVRVSEQTAKTFRKISDPANASLFTAEAALKAFAHIKG